MADGTVLVVGAGIGGLATAVALTKVGIPVKVIERSDDIREEGASINIGTNGWKAMHALGVADALRAKFVTIERYVTVGQDGAILNALDVADCAHGPHEIRGAIRNDLVRALADALPPGTICYGAPMSSLEFSREGAEAVLGNGETIKARIVIGADGAYSKIRAALGGGPTVNYAGWATYRGLATFKEVQPDYAQEFRMMRGKGGIVGLYPLDPLRVYYFHAFAVSEEDAHKMKAGGPAHMKADLRRRMKSYPCHMEEIVEHTPTEGVFLNHIGDRVIHAGETWGKELVTLIGDAAHPTTPALGQGGCMALEDGVELGAALRDAAAAVGVPWAAVPAAALEKALRDFERRRSTRCAPLVATAHANGDRMMARQPTWAAWLRATVGSMLGLGFLGEFFPKNRFWYMVWEPPSLHRLVTAS